MAEGVVFTGRGRYRRSAIEGMGVLERRLKRMTQDVRGSELRDAAAAGAEIVRDVASQLAPVSEVGSRGNPAGFLSENIEAEVQFTRNQDIARIHVGINKQAFYGWFQETGTPFQPAQPFLRPALDATKEDVVGAIRDHLAIRILGRL